MVVSWLVSGLQLLWLMKTLPHDQDAMEAELARYVRNQLDDDVIDNTEEDHSIVSLEDRITSFDGTAARETAVFLRQSIAELRPPSLRGCNGEEEEELPLVQPL